MQIRPATIEDLAAMQALGMHMHAESPRFSVMKYDEHKVSLLLRMAINDPAYFLMVAEKNGGDIIGGFLGYVAPMWFSQDLAAADLALFIEQDRRGGMAAARLVRDYIAWARERGAKKITAGISTGVSPEETAKLFEAVGMKLYGYLFEA